MTTTEPHWLDRVHAAEHEAAHAVAAQKMGLPVEWVTLTPGVTAEGLNYAAAVHIPDELFDYEQEILGVCVSMAAPMHIRAHREGPIGHCAQLEYQLATEIAGHRGIPATAVYDRSAVIVSEHWEEIVDLAQRLEAEGTVTFTTATV